MFKKLSPITIISYATIYIVWGSTYFFIRLSVASIPPYYVVGIRFLFGGIFFLLVSLITGRLKPLPTKREVTGSIILGTLFLLGGNGLITIAEQKIPSYIAALLISSTPIFVAFFNRALLKIKIGIIRLGGIIIGIAGVALLLYDGKSIATSVSIHLIFAIAGILIWSFATSIGHLLKVPQDSMVNTMVQMLFAGSVSFIVMIFSGLSIVDSIKNATLSSIIGVSFLGLIGSIALSAYNYLIKHEPSIRIVSYSLINPLIAVLLGIIIGREKIMPFFFFGIPMIISGLFLMLYGEAIIDKIRTKA